MDPVQGMDITKLALVTPRGEVSPQAFYRDFEAGGVAILQIGFWNRNSRNSIGGWGFCLFFGGKSPGRFSP